MKLHTEDTGVLSNEWIFGSNPNSATRYLDSEA